MEKSSIVGAATALKEKSNTLLDDFLLQLTSSLELLEQQKSPSTIKEHKLVLELAKLDPELLERLNTEAASKNLPVLGKKINLNAEKYYLQLYNISNILEHQKLIINFFSASVGNRSNFISRRRFARENSSVAQRQAICY